MKLLAALEPRPHELALFLASGVVAAAATAWACSIPSDQPHVLNLELVSIRKDGIEQRLSGATRGFHVVARRSSGGWGNLVATIYDPTSDVTFDDEMTEVP